MQEKYNICGYCGKQFVGEKQSVAHKEGYCGEYCFHADELIGQSARATELFSEDELEKFAGDFEPFEY